MSQKLFPGHALDAPLCNRRRNSNLRLFGKPESFTKRRMGVALAFDADVDMARHNAKLAASKVRPRVS